MSTKLLEIFSDIEYKYEDFPFSNKELMNKIHELKGKVLGCWCAPLPCHGDTLTDLANQQRQTKSKEMYQTRLD